MANHNGLEDRLRHNPYDLCALVGSLFESAARGNFAGAARLYAACDALHLLPYARKSLTAIAGGSLAVVRRGTLFYTRIPLAAPAEELFACIERAVQILGELVGRDPPVMWIDFQDIPPYANTIRRDVEGLCHLTLSSELFSSDAWRATAWHECGHALLSANCRFLDEGWGVWCQYKSGYPSFFPASPEEAAEGEIAASIAAMPLEGFLGFDAADPAFRDIAESDDEQISLYLRGYRFVASLIEASGCGRVADAFDQIASGADALAVLTQLSPAAVAAEQQRVTLAGIDRAFRWLRSRESKAGAAFIPLVRKALEAEPMSVEALELLGRMVGSLALNLPPGQMSRAGLVDELEGIIQRLDAIDAQNAIAEMLRGLHTISQIGLVPGALLMSISNKAEAHLVKAREMKAEDGDLNIALARLEMKKPFSWVADRANALFYLATAAADPRCRWEAVSIASFLSLPPDEMGVSP